MDFEIIFAFLKLIAALFILIGVMVVILKYGKKGMDKSIKNKYVRVIDRVQVSKDSFIVILKMGEEGMVLLTAPSHTEKLKELSKEEIEKIERDKQESFEEMTKVYDKIFDISKEKLVSVIGNFKSKGEKNEKKEEN